MPPGFQRREYYQPSSFYRNAGVAESTLANRLQEFSEIGAKFTAQAVAEKSAEAGEQAGMAGKIEPHSNLTVSGRAYNQAAEHAYLANQTVDIEETYSRIERESQGDPAKYAELTRGYASGVLSSAPPQLRNDIALMLKARGAQGRERIEGQAWLEQREKQRVDIKAGYDVMLKQALELVKRDDPESQAALEVLQRRLAGSLVAAGEAKLFSPAEIYELQMGAAEQIEQGGVTAAIDHQVSGILGAYRTDVYSGDSALAALAGSTEFDDATKEEIRSKVRVGVNLLQDERRRAYIESVNAVYVDLADGTPSPGLESRVTNLYRRAAIGEEAYTSLMSQIGARRVAVAEEEAAQVSFEEALAGGTKFDPKPSEDKDARKAADVYFKAQTAGVPRGGPEYQSIAVDIAQRTNIIPSDVFHWARTSMASGDPVEGAQAAMLLTRIKEANNLSWDYIEDSKAKAFSELVTDAVRSGSSPQDAVALAHKVTYGQTDSQREALSKVYSEQKVSNGNANALRSKINDDARFDMPWSMSGPRTDPTMQWEFDRQVQLHFVETGGDVEKARQMAYDDVTRTWGMSTVNGKPQMMKYAPEVRFAGELTAPIVRADIEATAPGLNAELMPIEQPGASTSRSGGLYWALGVRDEYGNLDPLLDDNNLPRVYELPVGRDNWQKRDTARRETEKAKAKAEFAKIERYRDLSKRVASGSDQDVAALLERWRRDDLATGN
jgi:hypothetical protein